MSIKCQKCQCITFLLVFYNRFTIIPLLNSYESCLLQPVSFSSLQQTETPLHNAVTADSLEIVELLLQHHASPNTPNRVSGLMVLILCIIHVIHTHTYTYIRSASTGKGCPSEARQRD